MPQSVRHPWPALALLATLALSGPAPASDCTKLVFNDYCLGGELAALLAEREPRERGETEGRQSLLFDDEGKTVEVEAIDGRIVGVLRREPPGSYLNFTDWKVKLVRLYGRAEDRSSFPAYAASRSARLNALNAGRGYSLVAWPQDGWEVSLRWDTPKYVTLEYRLDVITPEEPTPEEGL
jgi:hypothetical protein